MKIINLPIKTKTKHYSVIIGSNIIQNISKLLYYQNINFEKCLIVIDKNIPIKFRNNLTKNLKSKKKIFYIFNANEKNKSYKSIDKIQNILFKYRFNRF